MIVAVPSREQSQSYKQKSFTDDRALSNDVGLLMVEDQEFYATNGMIQRADPAFEKLMAYS